MSTKRAEITVSWWQSDPSCRLHYVGKPTDIAQMLFSTMAGDSVFYSCVMAAVEMYDLRRHSGGATVDTSSAFLAVMRNDEKYCAEITGAVLAFWTLAGVDCGRLSEMVVKDK